VAIYHLSVKSVSRAEGRSATAAAAYRAGELVHDHQTGQVFDYSRRYGVEHAEIVLSTAAAKQDINWPRSRQDLWNAAEHAERRKDARIAREYEIALPKEFSRSERLALTRAFAQEIADRYQCAVDLAIHRPHREGDIRNYHAHLLATTRQVTPKGLGAKTEVEWSNTDRRRHGLPSASEEMTLIRSRWAEIANEHLLAHGHQARIDHRTLEAQGIDREPTVHIGPTVSEMRKRGVETGIDRRMRWQELDTVQQRLKDAAELHALEAEQALLKRSILDLSNDLQGALAERERLRLDQGKSPSMEDIDARQQAAADRWQERQRLRELGLKGDQAGLTQKKGIDLEIEIVEAKQPKREHTHARDGPELEP
jgi:ATP-dependent exoDNAse (exonuclease V) alpha subunit